MENPLLARGLLLLENRFETCNDIIVWWAKVGAWGDCPAAERTEDPWWLGMPGMMNAKIVRGNLTEPRDT